MLQHYGAHHFVLEPQHLLYAFIGVGLIVQATICFFTVAQHLRKLRKESRSHAKFVAGEARAELLQFTGAALLGIFLCLHDIFESHYRIVLLLIGTVFVYLVVGFFC